MKKCKIKKSYEKKLCEKSIYKIRMLKNEKNNGIGICVRTLKGGNLVKYTSST